MSYSSSPGTQRTKPLCPHGEKCYRKNPIHFGETSHPHLEELLEDQMDVEPPILPDVVFFCCRDRTLVEDQLKILQKVLRRERGPPQVSPGLRSPAQPHHSQSPPINSPNSSQFSYQSSPAQRRPFLSQPSPSKPPVKQSPSSQPLLKSPPTVSESIDLTLDLSDSEPEIAPPKKRPASPRTSPLLHGDSSLPSTSSGSIGGNTSTPKRPRHEQNNTPSQNSLSRPENSQRQNNSLSRPENFQRQNNSSSRPENSQEQSASSRSNGPPRSVFDQYMSCRTDSQRRTVRDNAIRKVTTIGQRLHVKPPGQFDLKYAMSAPYFVFLSTIQDAPETWNQPFSITFPEILDISLGKITKSLHINFMVDISWLCLQHLLALQEPNFLVLYGQRSDEGSIPDYAKMEQIVPPSKYGCHHSKVSVLKYDKAIRIIVSTANLYGDDWDNRTQAVWISPHLPYLPEGSDPIMGESRTGFKADFIQYMKQYRLQSLRDWIDMFEQIDFSSIDVFFVASTPGSYKNDEKNNWGIKKLGGLLSQHAELPSDGAKWPIVAQSSSIGSFGPSINGWLGSEVIPALAASSARGIRSTPKFQFVYPTVENYKASFDGRIGSCCLPYRMFTHSKQSWIESYMYQWKAGLKGRDKAMPHSKIYTRISPNLKRIPWVVLTSANLSKAAWGTGKDSNYMMSWEAGVVFFPKFLTGENTFPVQVPDEKGTPPFPIPYDLPLTPYGEEDEAFVVDAVTV